MSASLAPSPSPLSHISHSPSLATVISVVFAALLIILYFYAMLMDDKERNDRLKYNRRSKSCETDDVIRILDRVATITFEYEPDDENGIEYSCAICMENFKAKDECAFSIKCNHVYHKACTRDKQCPLCRTSIRFPRLPV